MPKLSLTFSPIRSLPLKFLLHAILVLLLFDPEASAQAPACTASNACFDFSYKGYVRNSNNTVTLTFGIQTNCNHDFSHAAFELPAGAVASNMTHTNSAFSYSNANPTNNPFYSLKFNAVNASGYKNGVSDEFSYTIPAAKFDSMPTMRIQAKAATTVGTVTFNTKGCCDNTVPVSGSAAVCAGSTQTYSVTPVNGALYYTWTLPAGWTVVSGSGTPAITVKPNGTAGAVKVQAGINTCGTTTVSILTPQKPAVPTAISGPAMVCKNATYTYEVPAVTGADYYTWTVPAGWQILSAPLLNGFGNKINVKSGTAGGSVSVSAVSDVCVVQASAKLSQAVSIAPEAAIINISGDGTPCFGSVQTYTANARNAAAYTWTVPAGDTILTGQGTNTITVLVKNAGPQLLNVSVTGPGGCSSVTENLGIQVKMPQAITAQPVPGATFVGKNLAFSVQATGANLTYKWQVNSGAGWQDIANNATYQQTDSATLKLVNVPVAFSGNQYRCRINGCAQPLYSAAAPLTVTPAIAVNIRVLLEGPYNPATGFMNTGQNAAGVIPLSQPYNNTYWNYYGTESVPAGFFAANPNIVDWVLVEIRSGLYPNQVLGISANFLKKDGLVVGLDGQSLPVFVNVPDGNYYAVVHHRNHLSIISRTMIALNANPSLYDFTTNYEKSYGVNPVKRTADGRWAMYTGDANANGSVSTSDWNSFWKKETGQSGYLKSDWNLDGVVNQADYTLWYGNGGATTQVIR